MNSSQEPIRKVVMNMTQGNFNIKKFRNPSMGKSFYRRYLDIKNIEQENLRLASRLFGNKPWISKKSMDISYKNHVKALKSMSRYKNGIRKSVAFVKYRSPNSRHSSRPNTTKRTRNPKDAINVDKINANISQSNSRIVIMKIGKLS